MRCPGTSPKSPREIAGELGATHLLAGRVQREADRVRIWGAARSTRGETRRCGRSATTANWRTSLVCRAT